MLRRTAWIVPQPWKIPRESYQFPFPDVSEWTLTALLQSRELSFKLRLGGQSMVPATFEFRRDEPILRIYSVILTSGADHFIVRVLQGQGLLLNALVARSCRDPIASMAASLLNGVRHCSNCSDTRRSARSPPNIRQHA